jgi:hypothetical protein
LTGEVLRWDQANVAGTPPSTLRRVYEEQQTIMETMQQGNHPSIFVLLFLCDRWHGAHTACVCGVDYRRVSETVRTLMEPHAPAPDVSTVTNITFSLISFAFGFDQ